jgi:hypothetical protein
MEINLQFPLKIRILNEEENLKYLTLATVSRVKLYGLGKI